MSVPKGSILARVKSTTYLNIDISSKQTTVQIKNND
jgi:hypothetical protein